MAPLTPDWQQPSHPKIQKVVFASKEQYLSNSYSTIALPPFGFYAKLSFPPCTEAFEPTYATVQMGKDRHLNLNSDLVYINHSCEPSLIFDTSSLSVLAGPRGLSLGDELTFFYPSTEWDMAQGFDCFCGKPTCKGYISGAANMTPQQLEGLFLNAHIRELLEERNSAVKNGNGKAKDATEEALRGNVVLAKKMVGFAQKALESYIGGDKENGNLKNGAKGRNGVGNREMCGEMGGDTIAV